MGLLRLYKALEDLRIPRIPTIPYALFTRSSNNHESYALGFSSILCLQAAVEAEPK